MGVLPRRASDVSVNRGGRVEFLRYLEMVRLYECDELPPNIRKKSPVISSSLGRCGQDLGVETELASGTRGVKQALRLIWSTQNVLSAWVHTMGHGGIIPRNEKGMPNEEHPTASESAAMWNVFCVALVTSSCHRSCPASRRSVKERILRCYPGVIEHAEGFPSFFSVPAGSCILTPSLQSYYAVVDVHTRWIP